MTDTSADAVEASWEEYEVSAKPCWNDGDTEFYSIDSMMDEAHNLYTIAKALAAERDDLRAQLAEAQAQVQTARDALDECVPVLYAVAMGDTGYTIGWAKQAGVKARSALALILPTTDRRDAAKEAKP